MTRDRLLALVRTIHRLTPDQVRRVEDFIGALDPELSLAQIQGVALYVESLQAEAQRAEAEQARQRDSAS